MCRIAIFRITEYRVKTENRMSGIRPDTKYSRRNSAGSLPYPYTVTAYCVTYLVYFFISCIGSTRISASIFCCCLHIINQCFSIFFSSSPIFFEILRKIAPLQRPVEKDTTSSILFKFNSSNAAFHSDFPSFFPINPV